METDSSSSKVAQVMEIARKKTECLRTLLDDPIYRTILYHVVLEVAQDFDFTESDKILLDNFTKIDTERSIEDFYNGEKTG